MRKIRPPEEGEVLPARSRRSSGVPAEASGSSGGVPRFPRMSAPPVRIASAMRSSFSSARSSPPRICARALPAVLAGHVALVHLLGQQALAGL